MLYLQVNLFICPENLFSSGFLPSQCLPSFLPCCSHCDSSLNLIRFSFISLLKKNFGILSSFIFQTFHVHLILLLISLPYTTSYFKFSPFSFTYPPSLAMYINPLKTKRRLLYVKIKFVPLSKHFSSRL